MFYSVITWYAENEWEYPPPPTDIQLQRGKEMIDTLSPGFNSELTVAISSDTRTRLSMRSWPSEEAAQAWIDFALTNFDNITTATVSAEPADLTDFNIVLV